LAALLLAAAAIAQDGSLVLARTGRAILGLTVDAGLLASDSPKASVRLALPSKVLDSYFPQLFPLNLA
jgi:hypothetical protein